jgi:multiple sugar transport system ATP-binding protein
MAEVVLEGVCKRFPNGVEAVRDVSLTVADGELVVLVGPSGCGKTTTLRLLAGLEDLTAGTVRIAGRVVNALPPSRRDLAMVFQRPALYPHLTVRENLAFGLHLRRGLLSRFRQNGADVEARVREAARMLRLEDVLDRLPGELSGGQQQRAALGRAVVRRPAAFLLDEPLSNLDARLRTEMRRELHLLHSRLPATMIHVTHDQVEAMTLGDRVAVMHRGAFEQVDRPLALYRRPCNRFVAGFLGWPPMNFLDGAVTEQGGRACFVGDGWSLPLPAPTAAACLAYRGRPVTLGIRPEGLRLAAPGGGPGLGMSVVLVEPLGSAALVTLRRQGLDLTARLPPDAPPCPGDEVVMTMDLDQAHLFDRPAGVALWHGGAGG